jgi:uncharacterized membrane protein (DUF373 family)
MDDVLAEGVVFGLNCFVVLFKTVELADLFFELLDVAFFALTESTLFVIVLVRAW